jgi:hypothetical protein
MIRTRASEGLFRRLVLPAGPVLLAGLLVRIASGGPGPAPVGWDVRLTVSVQGTYTLRGHGRPLAGEFVCRARYEGRLHPDGDDFLLVHVRTDVLEWSLRETAGRGETASVLEAPGSPFPALRLNYILREKKKIELDFAFDGPTIPLHPYPLAIPLALPRTAGPVGARPGYDDLILNGSNRIVLPETDLLRRRPERTFAWSWRRHDRLEKGYLAFLVTQDHTVEAVVSFVRR